MSRSRKPPDLKSVAETKEQASKYVSTKETNKLVKEAILKELNSHLLSIKPQKIHQHERQGHERSLKERENSNPYKDENVEKKHGYAQQGLKPFVERHGQVSSRMSSRIPRPAKPMKEKAVKSNSEKKGIIQKYQVPGYTWHKNGRLNELKTRFLARKFSCIWMRNVFGRVPPYEARRFYERKLMKNAFSTLEDAWWKTRKGWKLNIRAEYHNRYRLWKNCFHAWKSYIYNQREKKRLNLLAVEFDEKIVLKKYLGKLRDYCSYRNERKIEKEKADRFHVLKSERFVLEFWKKKLHQSEVSKALEMEALSCWAFNLKSKMFTKWKLRKAQLDVENAKMASAIQHNSFALLKKCFGAFDSYVEYRRKKRYIKEFAKNHYQENLMRRTVQRWHVQLLRRLEIIELEDRIEFMSRKFSLRKYFIHWRFYIEITHENWKKNSVATIFHSRKVKARCFKALNVAAIQRKRKDERLQLASEFRYNMLISKSWNRWLMRCERSEELKMYPLTKIGRLFHRKNLLKSFFAQWRKYIALRRNKKKLYAIADRYFEENALPRFFGMLWKYKEMRQMKNQRKLEADAFNRELMFAKYFYTWLKHSRINQDFRMQERMAVLHHEESSKKIMLLKWRTATRLLLEQKRKEFVAETHNEVVLKAKYFRLLKGYVMEENKRRKQEVVAVSYDVKKKIKLTFISWKQYTFMRRIKRNKINIAESHYQKVLFSKIMCSMKVYLEDRRKIRKEVCKRSSLHTQRLLSWVFKRWHQNVVDSNEERSKYEIAQTYSDLKRLAEVFDAWKNYTALTLHKKFEANLKVEQIRETIDRGRLRRAFLAIIQFKEDQKRKKKLKEAAMKFTQNNLKRKCFKAWKEYKKTAFRKMLLQRQSEMFYVKVKLFQFFHKWKIQHKIAIHERNRSNVVLWLWSKNIQRKMLYAWREYVQISKTKKLRTMEALELRRECLLGNCLQKWFQYSTDMIAFRAKIAQTRQVEGTVKLQERVRKFAQIWYCKAKLSRRKTKYEEKDETMPVFANQIQVERKKFEPAMKAIVNKPLLQSIPGVNINRNQRLQPRKPDYLRDSFDLSELIGPVASGGKQALDASTDESQPRHVPPEPAAQTRLQKHPLHRSIAENSLEFGASSEDDVPAKREQPSTAHDKMAKVHSKKRDVILMPPSSFRNVVNIKKNGSQHEGKKRQSDEKFEVSESACSKLEDDENSESSYLSESDDESSKTNDELKDSQLIFKEILNIKEELQNYQNQENHLTELEKRCFHISSWLSSERKSRDENELKNDVDFKQAVELETQIQMEIKAITEELNVKKPIVRNLAMDVQKLTVSLQL